ncbi:hypothetical protein CKK33_11495 [Mucilaginibacter sp. MD40]|uniref:hypothetical protein n=1 Tax=Mucilaginibacter sp. MD40 TaxID=2029590 RepID=UPI000BAC817B|nr:hypothetical protein [Mucilaginibacter sp. MD40]PAW94085.1 hypothetical protein CKK33_11495 [Mucilaginibacter sp. MD40]
MRSVELTPVITDYTIQDAYFGNNTRENYYGGGGGGYSTPVQPITETKPMTLPISTNILKDIAGTVSDKISAVSVAPQNYLQEALDKASTIGAALGLPVPSPAPTTSVMGSEVTVTAKPTYWWLIVIVVCILAAILGYATTDKKKGWK